MWKSALSEFFSEHQNTQTNFKPNIRFVKIAECKEYTDDAADEDTVPWNNTTSNNVHNNVPSINSIMTSVRKMSPVMVNCSMQEMDPLHLLVVVQIL